MSQIIFADIDPFTKNGIQLASDLNDFKDAFLSNLSGGTRPAELTAGGLWTDTSLLGDDKLLLKMYDGTQDIIIATLDLNGGSVTPAPASNSFLLVNNQSSYADITGMSWDSSEYVSVELKYTIYRSDSGSTYRRESGTLLLQWEGSVTGWTLSRSSVNDALNIADSLTINTSSGVGTVQYKSDDIGGTPVGQIQWEITSLFAVEA